jgi:hypothetical protein
VSTKRPRLYVFDHERPCKGSPTQVDIKFWIVANLTSQSIRQLQSVGPLTTTRSRHVFLSFLAEPLPVLLMVRYFSLAPITHFDGLPSVHVLDRSVVSNLAWIGVFVALDEPQAVTGSLDCRDGAFNGVEDYIGYIWRLNKCKSCAAPV